MGEEEDTNCYLFEGELCFSLFGVLLDERLEGEIVCIDFVYLGF